MYEAIEITRQIGISIRPYEKVIFVLKMVLKEATRLKTQKLAKIIYVRFKVTICLYLSPNSRASSLSTLMAVIVNNDTPHNIWLVMMTASFV